jgi:ABC-type antimicrobial peptide transport system permease subunit
VNETLARRLWPGEPALGRRLRLAGAGGTVEIVGVARDGKYRTLGERPRPYLFLCLGQNPRGTLTLVVRADGDLRSLLPRILEVARQLDPQVPVGRPMALDEALGPVMFLPRAAASVLGAFGALALLLAGMGIYGVVAFIASGRVREVGLRMALGADRRQIVGWILGRGLRGVAIGVAAGLAMAAASTWALGGVLYEVHPDDPTTFIGVGLLLGLVALGAAFVPARRAARLEPSAALRHE